MIARFLMGLVMTAGTAAAGARSGEATVEWIGRSATCNPGIPLQTAIRMIHDAGWHSYWINPGEAGMATTVEWKLPPGWQTSGLRHPVPVRFLTGGLAGYGYEGTVLFPAALIPPTNFSGEAKLVAVITWLACSEEGCVPGKAEIMLNLSAGPAKPGPEAAAISAAFSSLPRPPEEGGARLIVTDQADTLLMEILPGSDDSRDFSREEVFPITPEVIDPRKPVRFVKSAGKWTATAHKNEYFAAPLRKLSLLLSGKNAAPPLELTWTAP